LLLQIASLRFAGDVQNAMKRSSQKLVDDEVERERKKESSPKAANNKVAPKPLRKRDVNDGDVLFGTQSSNENEKHPGNVFFQQILNMYRDAFRRDPRPEMAEQLGDEIIFAFKASGKRFMVPGSFILGNKKCYVEMKENDTKSIMAYAIAGPSSPAGTSSASTQGVDDQRFMQELHSSGLGNTLFRRRLIQPEARVSPSGFLLPPPVALGTKYQQGLPSNGLSTPAAFNDLVQQKLNLVQQQLNDLVQQKFNLAHGNDAGPRRNILENGQDMSRMLLAVPKYQQGLPPNGLLTERVPPALNDIVQQKCNLAHGRNVLENGQDMMSRMLTTVPKYQQGLPPNGFLTERVPPARNDLVQQKCNLAHGNDAGPRRNILENGQDMSMSRMLAVPKYQQGLPPNGISAQRDPAPLNDPEQQKLNLVQQQQYVLKNWQEKLSDSYRDIPETSLPRKDMCPYPKRKRDLTAAKKNKNEKRRRRSNKNESSSEDEHDSSSSSDEEEGAKIHSTPESAGTVVSFDDGRKWRVERVGNVSILSPYI
jgi:hypothetical protein